MKVILVIMCVIAAMSEIMMRSPSFIHLGIMPAFCFGVRMIVMGHRWRHAACKPHLLTFQQQLFSLGQFLLDMREIMLFLKPCHQFQWLIIRLRTSVPPARQLSQHFAKHLLLVVMFAVARVRVVSGNGKKRRVLILLVQRDQLGNMARQLAALMRFFMQAGEMCDAIAQVRHAGILAQAFSGNMKI